MPWAAAAFGIAVLGLLVLYYAPALAAKMYYGRRFLKSIKSSGCVCLTFDDGPDPMSTPRILEALGRFGVKATFFVVGERAERHPRLAAEIVAQGHELGEHAYSHFHAWKCGPLKTYRSLTGGNRVVRRFAPSSGGNAPFRPPFGKLNLAVLFYILAQRKPLALWNVDPRDYDGPPASRVSDAVTRKMGPGAVVLLHERHEVTIEALETILKSVENKSLKFATVTEALARSQTPCVRP
jgi:peptidoglycan/xylan/chitin deacetylase (PgdA/CDA1 family)